VRVRTAKAEILLQEAPAAWFNRTCLNRVRKENSPRALKFQVYFHTCLSRLTGTQTGETTHYELFLPQWHKKLCGDLRLLNTQGVL